MPAGLTLPRVPESRAWASLGEEEKRDEAKKMAVYAGMLDAADQNIGRFRDYLKKIGELDNTAFIVMSDNGADALDLSTVNVPFRIWYGLYRKLGYADMGRKGSYTHYGLDWAQVSNTPLSLFKASSLEGGTRVPFIVSWPQGIQGGKTLRQFAYATDFLPTVLDIAGIPLPGDDLWHLYKLSEGPTESRDLKLSAPERYQELLADAERYLAANRVVLPEPGYDDRRQLLANTWPVLLRQMWPVLAGAGAALLLLAVLLARWILRRTRR